jgi:RNA polymerase sigma factor (sigma-70 family)
MTEELIEQIRQNNRKAQEEFYKLYSVRMFRLIYRYVNNEQDAGSIVNTGFYKIFNSINRFKYNNEISFIAWMNKILINEALSFLRQKVTYNETNDNQSDSMASENIPENNLLLEDYYNLIRKLPQDLRTVFNLYAIDGYSHKEIATKLNIKESSSRVYLMRARKILQENLKSINEK